MTTATEQSYYEILGVPEDAPQDAIRKAYLKLTHKYHPDKTGGDKAAEEKLKAVNAAYDTLKNPDKRKEYDAMRANPFGGYDTRAHGNGSAGSHQDWNFEFSDLGGFSDLFGEMFGGAAGTGARWARAARPGRDLEIAVTVPLEAIAEGATQRLRVPRHEPCGACGGTGRAPDQPQAPCRTCNGAGRVTQERTIEVAIPAGMAEAGRLRLTGEGEPGANGGPAGDLYVRVTTAPHPFFKRDGADVICEIPVPLTTAMLGGAVRAPTLKGQADLKIAEGTQQGATLRMRGLGLPRPGTGQRGDQLVRVQVEIPAKLTAKQRELLKELAADLGHSFPKSEGFVNRLKRAWQG